MATTRFRTTLCDMLGIDFPVMLAAMAPDISDPQLVAAINHLKGLPVVKAPPVKQAAATVK